MWEHNQPCFLFSAFTSGLSLARLWDQLLNSLKGKKWTHERATHYSSTSILLHAGTLLSSETGQTQKPISSKSHLTRSSEPSHWAQTFSRVAAFGTCQHGQGSTQQGKLIPYMLEAAQTELLWVPGLNSSLVFHLQQLKCGAGEPVCYAALRGAFSTRVG